MEPTVKQVLSEIFGLESSWLDNYKRRTKLCPGFEDIYEYAKVLSAAKTEEEMQRVLADNPKFLLGVIGSGGDADVAFLTKPLVGTRFKADFATLTVGQGGCVINLVEIETPFTNIYTKQGTPARVLQKAISQVTDWRVWLEKNKYTFVDDLIKLVKQLPMFPKKSKNKSFRFNTARELEKIWRGFGGFDHPIFIYTIIISRWSKLSEDEKSRLTFNNSQENYFYQVMTYDQLARRAFDRPLVLF